ncbi:hemolysin family protein [Croceicoccus gelatinilyticus]|uniref:hemolysin family protein n=1 Tax=Croceicoccus gelatinilyticus TaxID=2835536 RepID=UPI001BD01917|nr:hemolysin family protein [Croceicoccus gelatinilyticus]MBS7669515.1 HlyC/CorC family transporter [Croceicoccus gelatinilyticus]
MSPFPWTDVLIIAGLILLNGLFSLSELAIVSSRPERLRHMAQDGSKRAKVALELVSDSGKFLSTVQIGITLIGIVAGAYSGASLGEPVGERLALLGFDPETARNVGFALVIVLTTYFSLVAGELAPKQIALRGREQIALFAAPPMKLLSQLAAPLVWLLDKSTSLLLRLIGLRKTADAGMTAEELKLIMSDATRSGAIEEAERTIMAEVLKLAERPVRELMTPRTEIDWIERRASEADIRKVIASSPHSLLPVAQGSVENIIGVVKVRELLAALLKGRKPSVTRLMKKAEIIPDQIDALDALRIMRNGDVAMALVHDEYGHFEGIVTPADLLQALVGQFAAHSDDGDDPLIVEREDGSLLLSGALPVDRLAEGLAIEMPETRDFATAAGYVLWVLKKLPVEGEYFVDQGWRIEIIDMDGRRIDKLLASREKSAPETDPDAD